MMVAVVAMVAAAFVACSDDDVDDASQGDDTDIEEVVDDEPTEDVVTSHIDRTAYIVDGLITANSERAMIDNFLDRYARTVPFRDLQTVVAGDAVAFEATALNELLGDETTASTIKDAYNRGAVLLMSGGQASDFARLCSVLDCYNPYAAETDVPPADGEKTLWVLSGELPGVKGVYAKLSPYTHPADSMTVTVIEGDADADFPETEETDEPGFMTDYRQGQLCQHVTNGINESLTPKVMANAGKNVRANAGQQELTDLMSATKVYLTGTAYWKNHYKKKAGKTAYYCIELNIWNAYSETEEQQYYLIHQEMTYSFGDYCIGSWHSNAWKCYGRYGKYFETTFRNTSKPEAVTFHRLSPGTTQSSTSYTSSVGFNLGGSVSTKSGAGITGGINISHSRAYTVEDVTVYNNSVATTKESKAAWKFDMRDAKGHFNWKAHGSVDIDPCSASGRSTFVCGTDYIFSVPKGTPNKWNLKSDITTRVISCNFVFGAKKTSRTDKYHHEDISVTLPEVPVK